MQNDQAGERLRYEQTLTREEQIALKNKRTGILIFQMSWIMAFVALVIVNWQLRFTAPTWPPAGVEPLNPVLPTLATGGLLLSGWLARRAVVAITHDHQAGLVALLRGVLVLGAIFIAVMVYEWLAVPPVPQGEVTLLSGEEVSAPITQYNAIFRVMTAFHAVHALAIGAYIFGVFRKARAGAYSSVDYWEVEASAKLWYFVVVAWIIFYVVLYWI